MNVTEALFGNNGDGFAKYNSATAKLASSFGFASPAI